MFASTDFYPTFYKNHFSIENITDKTMAKANHRGKIKNSISLEIISSYPPYY